MQNSDGPVQARDTRDDEPAVAAAPAALSEQSAAAESIGLGVSARRTAWFVAVSALVVGSLVMLWPALVAPLGADQRFMYLEAPGRASGDWWRLITIPLHEIPMRLNQGRFAPLGYIVQWLSYGGVTQFSIATGTSIAVIQALQKLVLLGMCLGSVLAFTGLLRGRTRSGVVVAPGRRSTILIACATTVFVAAGTQAHDQSRNGWTTYAVLTYGAVIVGFGVPALCLWLLHRLALRPSTRWTILAVVLLVATGMALNSSYELYYAAFPAALIALVLQPVGEPGDRMLARRAKMLVGATLSGAFLVSFTAVRVAVHFACANKACYVGITPKLDATILQTWFYNVASSLPVAGIPQAGRTVAGQGFGSLPGPFSSPLVVFCLVAALGLVAVRLLVGTPSERERAGDRSPVPSAEVDHARSRALLVGALVALALGLGSAAVMSVSAQAQVAINNVGEPYRHIVVTWVSIVVAGTLCLLAVDLRLGRRGGVALWTGAAAVAAVVSGIVLPVNLESTRAQNADPSTQAVMEVYQEVAEPDPTPAGAARRCEAAHLANRDLAGKGPIARRMLRGADRVYQRDFGKPFCASGRYRTDRPGG